MNISNFLWLVQCPLQYSDFTSCSSFGGGDTGMVVSNLPWGNASILFVCPEPYWSSGSDRADLPACLVTSAYIVPFILASGWQIEQSSVTSNKHHFVYVAGLHKDPSWLLIWKREHCIICQICQVSNTVKHIADWLQHHAVHCQAFMLFL